MTDANVDPAEVRQKWGTRGGSPADKKFMQRELDLWDTSDGGSLCGTLKRMAGSGTAAGTAF